MFENLKHWIKYSNHVCVECEEFLIRSQAKHSIFCEACDFRIRSANRKVQLVSEILSQYATRFDIVEDVMIEKRGKDKWCVQVFGGTVLDKDLNRHYEPSPSNRTEEFISATRFTLEDAYTLAKKYIDNGDIYR